MDLVTATTTPVRDGTGGDQETSTSTTDPQMLERQPGKGLQMQLALDDAFADGDDQPFEFNSAAAREHLAEQEHWTTVHQATETGSVDELDTSISTLHLDGSTPGTKSDSASFASCASQSHTPVEPESHDLSKISLSEPEEQVDHHTNVLHEKDYDREEPTYPTVHIDISKPPSSRISVTTRAEDGTAESNGTHSPEPPSPVPSALDFPTTAASSSLPNAQASIPPSQSHRPPRSTGPTAFQKVVSRTRPHFLPPKNRQEDLKHLADWEAMMERSRAAGDTPQLTVISLH